MPTKPKQDQEFKFFSYKIKYDQQEYNKTNLLLVDTYEESQKHAWFANDAKFQKWIKLDYKFGLCEVLNYVVDNEQACQNPLTSSR